MMHQKLLYYFRDLGYDTGMIEEVFSMMEKSDSSVIQKEYEKQVKRLSKKYQGTLLQQKVKEKLYQKGFSWDEIQSVIQN